MKPGSVLSAWPRASGEQANEVFLHVYVHTEHLCFNSPERHAAFGAFFWLNPAENPTLVYSQPRSLHD